jgi:flagellar motor switch protein FliN/FliY
MSSMSSLQTSSSSSKPADGSPSPFSDILDVVCPVTAVLGTGTVKVADCLALARNSVLKLEQSAGEDLQVVIHGTLIARGEVVIIEDTTALRVTEIAVPFGQENGS